MPFKATKLEKVHEYLSMYYPGMMTIFVWYGSIAYPIQRVEESLSAAGFMMRVQEEQLQ